MVYACAIPPLDQTTTSIGWLPGLYAREQPCLDCGWDDRSLSFLADPGTPVVAPFPVTVVSTRPFIIRPTVEMPRLINMVATDIRIYDTTPAVTAGAQLQKGDLLGRVATGKRGSRWAVWGPDAVFGTVGEQPFIVPLFDGLGLGIVGAAYPDPIPTGFSRTPQFGGRLLVRARGPADCASGALHGLGTYLSAAPSGYVETPSSVYSRYGVSGQTDLSVPRPSHQNVAVEVAGGGFLTAAAIAGLVWWVTRE